MNVASVAFPETTARRRPGRPRADTDPRQWDRHYECAGLYFQSKWPVKRIARSLDVCRATVYLWVRLALEHDDERAELMHRLARETPRGRRWLKRLTS